MYYKASQEEYFQGEFILTEYFVLNKSRQEENEKKEPDKNYSVLVKVWKCFFYIVTGMC